LNERPPEYLFSAMKSRKSLLNVLNNKIWFCLVDPEICHKECINYIEEASQILKLTKTVNKEANAPIKRILAVGASVNLEEKFSTLVTDDKSK
jgi:uncharacterized protein YueI